MYLLIWHHEFIETLFIIHYCPCIELTITTFLLQYLKYFPVTFSKLSSTAQCMFVCAPSHGDLKNRDRVGYKMVNPGKYLPSSVATEPGWSELTVTPVPKKWVIKS